MIEDIDKKIIGQIQGDLPQDARPFAVMAEEIGISEAEFIRRVKAMQKKGIIRRFGATLRHQEAGYSANAMVAWIIPDDQINEIGEIMAEFPVVTHCYQRQPQKDWRYNLYTMIHGDTEDECVRIARQMSEKTNMKDYTILFSLKEFKKTSMEYF
jgi:DNA-binding Lrp family transcriptional regulator